MPHDENHTGLVWSATNAVFGTNELLENILAGLVPADILRCQRVARSWRDCIEGSSPLQLKLFQRHLPVQHAWFILHSNFFDSFPPIAPAFPSHANESMAPLRVPGGRNGKATEPIVKQYRVTSVPDDISSQMVLPVELNPLIFDVRCSWFARHDEVRGDFGRGGFGRG